MKANCFTLYNLADKSPSQRELVSSLLEYQQRRELESFIHSVYALTYQANVRHYLPSLLGIRDECGMIQAALGLRNAGVEKLFLEQYLSLPVENLLAVFNGSAVSRQRIVELGNLAARQAGAARRFILGLVTHLYEAGYEWVVFTATPGVVNSFVRLGLVLQPIAQANKSCLSSEAQADWGSYYDCQPMVYAGNIREGHRKISRLLRNNATMTWSIQHDITQYRASIIPFIIEQHQEVCTA